MHRRLREPDFEENLGRRSGDALSQLADEPPRFCRGYVESGFAAPRDARENEPAKRGADVVVAPIPVAQMAAD
jgi:hypothetical protein